MGLFGFSLPKKKQIQGLAAQANPFDGGRTYKTVVNNRQPVANSGSAFRRTASRAFDQVNPLDSGRTWKQRTTTSNISGFQQAKNRLANSDRFTSSFNERLHGGNARAVIRTGEWLLPGDQKNTANKMIDTFAPEAGSDAARNSLARNADKNSFGGQLGTGAKFVSDVGAMVAPTGAVDKFMKGTRAVQYLSKGGNIAKGAGYVARVAPGSLVGSGVDAIQEIGRGNEVNPVKSGAVGLGIDLALPVVGKGLVKVAKKVPLEKAVNATSDIANKAVNKTVSNIKNPLQTAETRQLRDTYSTMQKQFDNLPANSPQRRVLNTEMARISRQIAGIEQKGGGQIPIIGKSGITEPPSSLTKGLDNVERATLEAGVKGKEPRSLVPDGTDEVLEGIDLKNKLLLEKMGIDTTPRPKLLKDQRGSIQIPGRKPKVALKGDLVDSSLNNTPTAGLDNSLRNIAQLGGIDIGQADSNLGLINKGISAVTGGKYTTTRGLNPFRAGADAAGAKIAKESEAALTGKGAPALNKARAVFAGTGLADETKQISRVRHGQYANIKEVVGELQKKSRDVIERNGGDDAVRQLDLALRDDAYIKSVYGPDAKKLSLNDLSPELRQLAEQRTAQNKIINDINLSTEVIDKGQWAQGTEGQHIARVFNIPKGEKQFIRESLNGMFEANAGIKRKDITKMSDELLELLEKDPIAAIEFRTEMALRNQALTESMDGYAGRGFIKKTKPNDNFVKMSGKKFGKYDGQYAERSILEEITGNRMFVSDMAQSYDRLVNSYKGSIIGVSDRLQKAFKTTMAPGTIVGNISSNPLIFNPGAGTNPLTQMYDMIGAARKMSKGLSDADVYQARQLGVIGGDTGKLLTGSGSETLATGKKTGNIAEKALSKFGQFYGSIDDTAKLGLWNRLRKQGMDPQKAALEVAKFTQDYNNVGRTITLIADTPVLGKPFARFSPELVRIIKNNATRAPHRLLAGIAGVAYIGNKLSDNSGESVEERTAREGAVGQTRIPGTAWVNKMMGGPEEDVSLNFAVGDTSVNIARSMGLNFPMEPGVNPNQALIEQLLPFEIPTTKDAVGNTKFDPTKVVTSMTLRPAIEQLFDKNFMGGQVSDPTNRSYDSQGNEKKFTELSTGDQIKNRVRSLAVSTLPFGNEADALISAATGNPTSTGKERTLPQAALRVVGVKTEDNSPEARAKRADTAEYFDTTKEAESKFLRENSDLEQLYFDVFPKTKDRNTNTKISDQITPEKWTRVQSDTSGRLYNFMKSQALEAEKKGQPADPVFKLPTDEQRRVVLAQRSKPTGEDIEMDNILEATQPWYRDFKKAEQAYYDKSSAFYASKDLPDTQNKRAKDYGAIKWPEQPSLIQQYYTTKEKNPEAAKDMFKTTGLSEQFDAYEQEKLKYYNAKRKIEGYPPISATTFNNVTFGYEEDESKVFNELKYGKGYGGYGSGGGGGGKGRSISTAQYLGNTQAITAKKPSVSIKAPTKYATAKKTATSKPTVSIKKSKV